MNNFVIEMGVNVNQLISSLIYALLVGKSEIVNLYSLKIIIIGNEEHSLHNW